MPRINPQPPTPNPQPLPSPHWRTDFPVNWDDDHYITRREFASFLTLISGALFLGTGLVGLREWWKRWRPARPTPVCIAQVTEVPVGGVKLCHYPTPDDPCLLIRLSTDRFVAYSQKCTHLSCAVYYQPNRARLFCPCHDGVYDPESGEPVAGPPQRRLPRIALRQQGNQIYAVAEVP